MAGSPSLFMLYAMFFGPTLSVEPIGRFTQGLHVVERMGRIEILRHELIDVETDL